MTKESQLSLQDEFDEADVGEEIEDLDNLDDDYGDSHENLEDYDDFRANGEPDNLEDLEHTANNSN